MDLSRRNFLKAALAGAAVAALPITGKSEAEASTSDTIGHTVSPGRAISKHVNIMMPKMAPHHDIEIVTFTFMTSPKTQTASLPS